MTENEFVKIDTEHVSVRLNRSELQLILICMENNTLETLERCFKCHSNEDALVQLKDTVKLHRKIAEIGKERMWFDYG